MTINFPPSFAKSWKTSLLGILSLFVSAWQGFHDPTMLAAIQDPKVQMAVLVGVIGLVAKDGNVTGGTSGQPSTPQALADANQAAAKGANAPEAGK
jgi:hypothetical protein